MADFIKSSLSIISLKKKIKGAAQGHEANSQCCMAVTTFPLWSVVILQN